ncbi:protein kinase C delta type-like [Pseudophryne corroboree]|uniref:protein kinase C delta type-like n=1 Tax=Pseudophryne corroboree TaxID=495146 RepID=UPI0030812B58
MDPKKRKRPNNNGSAIKELAAPSKRKKEEDICEERGDVSKMELAGDIQVREENQSTEIASKTLQKKRTRESSDESPTMRKMRKTSSGRTEVMLKRMASKRPSDRTGDSGTCKKKKEEEHHDSPGEGPSMPIIPQASGRRGIKRTHTSEETGNKRRRSADASGISVASTPETTAASHLLASLTFHRMLGEGGFGKVFLASHSISKQRLAVKVIEKSQEVKSIKKYSMCVEKEVLKITGESAFFPHTYAAFHTPGHIFFVMEYLSGGDLFQLIQRRGPFDVPTIRFFAAEILCGLQFLHTRGIVHRDIKTDNILLDAAGHVKIADFGLSVMNVHGDKKISGQTGTLYYMAPEITSNIPYNTTVDLFSFGVVLFEMATGVYPFHAGDDSDEVMLSIRQDAPCYPSNLHPEIRDILERLLCKDPEERQKLCSNIKCHPFFKSINWKQLEAGRITPPFTMYPTPETMAEAIPLDDLLSPTESAISSEDECLFTGFSFTSDMWTTMTCARQTTSWCILL